MERVRGRCPAGCGETLFLGKGGYVTCSWMECPDPALASQLLSREPIKCFPSGGNMPIFEGYGYPARIESLAGDSVVSAPFRAPRSL